MSDLNHGIEQLRTRLVPQLRPLSHLGPLLVRLTLGTVFISSGWGKLNDLDKVTEFFSELGIVAPAFNASLVACTEFIGGAMIAVGLATRLVALPLAVTMVVAIITAQLPDVSGIVELAGLSETAYLVMFLALVFGGPGAWSLDRLIVPRLLASGEKNHHSVAQAMS